MSSSVGISEVRSLHQNHPGSEGWVSGCDRPGLSHPLGPAATPGRGSSTPSRQTPRQTRHSLLPWAVFEVGLLSHHLCSAAPSSLPAANPAGEPLSAARGRWEAAQQKADPVSPRRLISARKSPARPGGDNKWLHLHFSPRLWTCAAPREPGRAGRCEGRGVSPRPPPRLCRPRVEILPSGGGRDEEAPARPGLCAPHAPRSLSAAQGRSIAAPRPRRRGGSGTTACIGAITVSARPRWRPEDVRGSGAGSGAGAGRGPWGGRARHEERRHLRAAHRGRRRRCPGLRVPALRLAPALRVAQRLSGIRTLPGVALPPQGCSAGRRRHPHHSDRPCDCLQPGSPLTDRTGCCSPAPPHRPHLHPTRITLYLLPVRPSPYLTQPAHCHHGHKSLSTALLLQGGSIMHRRMSYKQKSLHFTSQVL